TLEGGPPGPPPPPGQLLPRSLTQRRASGPPAGQRSHPPLQPDRCRPDGPGCPTPARLHHSRSPAPRGHPPIPPQSAPPRPPLRHERRPAAQQPARQLEHTRKRPGREIETRFPKRAVSAKHVIVAGEQHLAARRLGGQVSGKKRVLPRAVRTRLDPDCLARHS